MRSIRGVLYVGAFLLAPSFALAAGFATQPLFLSQTSVTEGDTVQMYAVVSNSDLSNKFSGTIVFQDATTTIGTIPVTLAAGAASTASISWKPVAGSHDITAELTDSSGTVAGQESATFLINPKQQLAAASAAGTTLSVGSSQPIQQSIASFSPVVASTTQPLFSTIDSVRTVAAHTLDNSITWSKQQISKAQNTKQLLGSTAVASSSPNISAGNSAISTAWVVLATVLLYILSILRYIVANAGFFYPLLAILFFYILWRTFKHFRRPRYY